MLGFYDALWRKTTARMGTRCMARIPLRVVSRVTDAYFTQWFLADSTVVTTALTAREYADLGKANAVDPPGRPTPGAQWAGRAWAETRYNTVTGARVPGDIYRQADGLLNVLLPDEKRQTFLAADILRGDLETDLARLSTRTLANGCRLFNGELEVL